MPRFSCDYGNAIWRGPGVAYSQLVSLFVDFVSHVALPATIWLLHGYVLCLRGIATGILVVRGDCVCFVVGLT